MFSAVWCAQASRCRENSILLQDCREVRQIQSPMTTCDNTIPCCAGCQETPSSSDQMESTPTELILIILIILLILIVLIILKFVDVADAGFQARLDRESTPDTICPGGADAAHQWIRFAAGMRHVAKLRRLWAALGTHLNAIKDRGK